MTPDPMRFLALSALLSACGGDTGTIELPTDAVTDVAPPPDTGGSAWPVWLYQSTITTGTAELTAVDGAAALRVDGYPWGASFGGPTLVAELDQEVRFTVTNLTSVELPFAWPGVEVIDDTPIPASGNGTAVFRTTRGPGVSVAAATTEDLARRGVFGLITVRDPDVFPVADLDFQMNLVVLDTPPEHSEVDACRFDATTPATCPAWRPAAEGETTALLTQRLVLNQAPVRHGSGPNEFLTLTVRSVEIPAGDAVRINLASLADGAHTISLGGLSAVDPSGATVTEVALGAGEATSLLLESIGPAGSYVLGCVDHDHHGLGQVALTVPP